MQLPINEWSSHLQFRILVDTCGQFSYGQLSRMFHFYTFSRAFHKPN